MLKQKKTPIINEMEDAKKELDSLIVHQIERINTETQSMLDDAKQRIANDLNNNKDNILEEVRLRLHSAEIERNEKKIAFQEYISRIFNDTKSFLTKKRSLLFLKNIKKS